MQVEAIYNRGALEFARPLKLKHDHLRLVVEVPDDEFVQESGTSATTLLARVDAVLAPYQSLLAQATSSSQASYQEAWQSHLQDKHLVAHEKSNI